MSRPARAAPAIPANPTFTNAAPKAAALRAARSSARSSLASPSAALAVACATAGADVGLTYRTSQPEAEDVAGAIRTLGRQAHVWRADTADAQDVARLAADAKAALGRVDVWINNAGADILTGKTAK